MRAKVGGSRPAARLQFWPRRVSFGGLLKNYLRMFSRRLSLSVGLLGLLAVASCTKDRDRDFLSATVQDTGDISKGGCGFLLNVVNRGAQRPDYLPSKYQHNGMKVQVKYHDIGVLDTCGNSVPYTTYDLIAIDDIRTAL